MPERILITGARAAVALDLARECRLAGYEVHLADSTPCRMARASRAVTAFHPLASPRFQPDRFRQDIWALAQALAPVRIIPTCEEVFHLARPSIAGVLGDRLFAPGLNVLAVLHDKHSFSRLAERAGLAVPETHAVTSARDLAAFANEAARWVFKPCFSRFGARALVGPSAAMLAGVKLHPGDRWVAQRRIEGEEYSFYAVAQAGRIAAFAAYGSPWRLSGGASFAFMPAPDIVEQTLLHAASVLAEITGLTGQLSCDAMVDASGRAWLIECNPRATSGLHLLTGSGVLASIITGAAEGPLLSHRRPRYLLAAMCSYGLEAAARQGRWLSWWADFCSGRDVVGAPSDRLPFAGAILDMLAFKRQAARAGLTTAQAVTADMEWNGEQLS